MLTQRLGSSTQLDRDFIREFIRIVKEHPGSCDEVWLATSYGFPPLSVHQEMAEQLGETAALLREAGLRVSLQISNTIGHGQYMSARDCSGLVYDGSPVQNIVGPDGNSARYAFCWNDPVFRDYVRKEVKLYAEKIQPHTVWIDDDLRATNHAPVQRGCFCDSCIRRYNERFGTSFSREELVRAVSRGELRHRENFVAFLRDGLYDFTFDVYSAIHAVSPETCGGLQNGPNGGYTGYGIAHLYDAMRDATGKAPKSRPGGGAYRDHNPNDMLWKADCLAFQNAMLPEYVTDIRPEIENLPDVRFGKTIAGTCMETSLYLASGATAMSYAMLMNDYEEADWHGEMLAAFAAHRPYWLLLSAASRDTVEGGLTLALGHEIWKRKLSDGEDAFAWGNEPYGAAGSALAGTAIPLTFRETKHPVYLLHEAFVSGLTDAEIQHLLDSPVLTSGSALAALAARGYGAEFSAEALPLSTGQLSETYNMEHPVNAHVKKLSNHSWSQSFYYSDGYALRDKTGETEPLGWYQTGAKNAVPCFPEDKAHPFGVCNAIVKTSAGARWAVFGHQPWNNVVSLAKRNQLLRAADYVSGNALPAILETGVQAQLLPREDKDGFVTSVSVLNRTIGESGPLTLRIRRPFGGAERDTVRFLGQYRQEAHLPVLRDGDELLVTLPSLAPWTVGTVFLRG